MDVIIQGHNLRVNDALETFTRRKLDKLDRYLPNIRELQVDLSHERTRRGEDMMIAQITIRHTRGAILRAQEKMPGDINAAITSAVDKMYTQIQRFKGKRTRKGRERFSISIEELNIADDEFQVAPRGMGGDRNRIDRAGVIRGNDERSAGGDVFDSARIVRFDEARQEPTRPGGVPSLADDAIQVHGDGGGGVGGFAEDE